MLQNYLHFKKGTLESCAAGQGDCKVITGPRKDGHQKREEHGDDESSEAGKEEKSAREIHEIPAAGLVAAASQHDPN